VIRNTFTPFTKPDQEVPPALISDLLRRYSTKEGYTLYPDVQEFFQRIQRYKGSGKALGAEWPFERTIVGIITNSDDRVPGILESFGLQINSRRYSASSSPDKYSSTQDDVDFVVLSYDVGYEKPDKRVFGAAVSMLAEMTPENPSSEYEKLYVGDDLEKDYDGAEAVGWNAVLVDRNGIMDWPPGRGPRWVPRERGFSNPDSKRALMTGSLLDLPRYLSILKNT
jgi:FMN phosphatase YigB (HAD superfamily)